MDSQEPNAKNNESSSKIPELLELRSCNPKLILRLRWTENIVKKQQPTDRKTQLQTVIFLKKITQPHIEHSKACFNHKKFTFIPVFMIADFR